MPFVSSAVNFVLDYLFDRDCLTTTGWASIAKGGVSDRNRNVIEPIEAETLTRRRRKVQAAGPAWALGPEDRSNAETKIQSHVEVESIEPRPALTWNPKAAILTVNVSYLKMSVTLK